ncbi:MAG: surface-adhesin E family protein [Chloroflexota bacterium]
MNPISLLGCALILAVFAHLGAEGVDWVYVETDAVTGNEFYIKSAGDTRTPEDVVRVWIKTVVSDKYRDSLNKRYGLRDVQKIKALWEYNCAARQMRLIANEMLSSQGALYPSGPNENAKWDPIPPDSISEHFYRRLCPERDYK